MTTFIVIFATLLVIGAFVSMVMASKAEDKMERTFDEHQNS